MAKARAAEQTGIKKKQNGSPGDVEDLLQRGFRFAFSLAHDRETAEDLLQEAWLAVIRAKGPWKRSYLFTTIRNRYIDQWRRRKRVVMEPLPGDEDTRSAGPSGFRAEDQPVYARKSELEEALGRLKPEERNVLYLSAVEGYTAQEIGEMLSKPRGSVLSMMHRSRKNLRNMLESKPGEEP